MANIKISAMTSLSSVTDSTTFPVVDSGTNYKITASQLKTYIGAGSSYSNTNVSAYLTANPPTGTYSNSNVASYLPTFSGNITSGNANLGNLVVANYHQGVLTTASQPNITSVGTLLNTTMGSSNSLSGGNLVSATYLTGTLTTAAQPNITSTGTLTSLTVTGNVTGGNIVSGGVANITGNITGANLIAGSSGQGNVYAGNVIVNGQPTTYGVVNPAYMVVGLATSITGFGVGSTVIFDTVVGNVNSQASYNASTGVFTLTAGVTYDMSFTASFITFTNTTGGYLCYDWVDATTNALLDTTGIGTGTVVPYTDTGVQTDNPTARVIYTPSTNQTVKLRVSSANGTATLRGSIGTQAIVRPLNLSIAVQATATGTLNNQYVNVTNAADQTVYATGTDIIWDTLSTSSGIAYSTSNGQFTLTAGSTYNIVGMFSFSSYSTNGYLLVQLVDSTTNTAIGNQQISAAYNTGYNEVNNISLDIIYTPGTNQTVKFRVTGGTSGINAKHRGGYFSRAAITQINQAFSLNTLATISTTGNVSVGGNLTVTGGVRKNARVLTTTTTLTVADASGFIEFAGSGTYTVTLPDPTQAANSGIGYRFWQNTSQNITLSTPAGTFYGPSGSSASTKVLAQATTQYWDVWSDGYNWIVFGIKTV